MLSIYGDFKCRATTSIELEVAVNTVEITTKSQMVLLDMFLSGG